MRKYRSLVVWQRAHRLSIGVLRATDRAYHPRSRAVFDQLRRAALSIEANIVAPLDELMELNDQIIGNLFGLVRKGIHTKV